MSEQSERMEIASTALLGGGVMRQDLDLLYAAILRCDIGNPWDAESGCPRPMPESVKDAVATFDNWHLNNIADVNAALDLCRALYAKCPPNPKLTLDAHGASVRSEEKP